MVQNFKKTSVFRGPLKYLSDNAVIILDDGNRPDEKEIVKLWKKEYDCFEGQHLNTQREIGFFERKK